MSDKEPMFLAEPAMQVDAGSKNFVESPDGRWLLWLNGKRAKVLFAGPKDYIVRMADAMNAVHTTLAPLPPSPDGGA